MTVPILVVAFNRPKLTGELLAQLENLPQRLIFISVDGSPDASSQSFPAWEKTTELIHAWKTKTKHSCSLRVMPSNLGCNAHTLDAMRWFLTCTGGSGGLLLEDDVEVQSGYLQFLDSINFEIVHKEFVSICGTNSNWKRDLALKPPMKSISWFSTSILSQTWGMTFSTRTVKMLDSFLREFRFEPEKIERMIEEWSLSRTSGNLMLRIKFKEYWLGKYRRVLLTWDSSRPGYSKNQEVGWDAVLQLAAATNGEDFLVPDWNVARTSLEASDGAWHEWRPAYPKWESRNRQLDFSFKLVGAKRYKNELSGLRFSSHRFPILALWRHVAQKKSRARL